MYSLNKLALAVENREFRTNSELHLPNHLNKTETQDSNFFLSENKINENNEKRKRRKIIENNFVNSDKNKNNHNSSNNYNGNNNYNSNDNYKSNNNGDNYDKNNNNSNNNN